MKSSLTATGRHRRGLTPKSRATLTADRRREHRKARRAQRAASRKANRP